MKRKPTSELVYEQMFPKPRQNDPPNFQALLHRSLIPEVRQETHSFYGHIDTLEAKYPGLDYCHKVHRIRLGRFPWHRRLFRAFDALRLTPAEIADLTKWEGTNWAKGRYEREHGVQIHDTAADDMPHADSLPFCPRRLSPTPEESLEDEASELDEMDVASEPDDSLEDDESDVGMESVGLVLNERLRDQIARREAGDVDAVLDEEWEQWFKNALEGGQSIDPPHIIPPSISLDVPHNPSLFPSDMLNAARAGQWDEIPESLHSTLTSIVAMERGGLQIGGGSSLPTQSPRPDDRRRPHSQVYRRYSLLRLPQSNGPLARAAAAREGL